MNRFISLPRLVSVTLARHTSAPLLISLWVLQMYDLECLNNDRDQNIVWNSICNDGNECLSVHNHETREEFDVAQLNNEDIKDMLKCGK